MIQPISPSLIEVLDQRVLRYFLAVVRAGSIRGGADALHVTPSTISRQITELEAICGHILLVRLTRGVAATEAGRAVADFAQRQLDHVELLMDRLTEIDRVGQGTVSLWCGDGVIPDLLTNTLPRLMKDYPEIAVRLTSASTDEIVSAVEDGTADVGVAYHAPVRADVQVFRQMPQPIVAILPVDHRFANHSVISLRDLAREPSALYPRSHAVRQLLAQVEATENFRLNGSFETGSNEAMRLFVRNRLGISFCPVYACAQELRDGTLAGVKLADKCLQGTAAQLLVKAGRRLPSPVETLLQVLSENLKAFCRSSKLLMQR